MPATASRDIAVLPDTAELSSPEAVLRALEATRRRTLDLISHLDSHDMERVLSPIMSPLVWDLAHIAAYEDLWLVHRHAGAELLRPELAELYDAFETPRRRRGEIELLDTAQAHAYMREVSERSAAAIEAHGVGDGLVHEMVVRHELQHTETMRQSMALADILPPGEPPQTELGEAGRAGVGAAHEETGGWLELPAGEFTMGAGPNGFAYDNERPRHKARTGAFHIARRPVSKASWLRFSEGGGYERREWWSDEGWAWKEEYDITHDADAATGDPQAPVCHVSWFEADAFARANEARLPTEAEWERAATWEQGTDAGNGDAAAGNGAAPAVNGATPPGGVPLAEIGRVWEWTSTTFHGYPGFEPYPYRKYSEVFFGPEYRVLRGGSWATHPRVATRTFRNWDLPQRRQIFSGLRLTKDV